jgi:hypothetical protein
MAIIQALLPTVWARTNGKSIGKTHVANLRPHQSWSHGTLTWFAILCPTNHFVNFVVSNDWRSALSPNKWLCSIVHNIVIVNFWQE